MACNSTGCTQKETFTLMVSKDMHRITEIVLDLTINFLFALLGSVTNIMVIAVFAKQGFKDSVGISMTVIAIWDLIKCLGAAAQRMSGPISLIDPAKALTWSNISIVVFNYLISFSSYVTSVLAAYVAVERCLCVCVPLKVKKLLTRKVSFFVCTLTSSVVFGWFSMMFGIYDIVWVYDNHYNQSIATYITNDFSANNTHLFEFYNISGIVWPMASLIVILCATVIISYKLNKASSFRYRNTDNSSVSGTGQSNANVTRRVSRRDDKVIKMLLVIVAVYIVSLFPRVILYMGKYFVYEFYFLRKYHELFMTTTFYLCFFDLLNGAINLFIFHRMSSSFRITFNEMFHFSKQPDPSSKVYNKV